VQYLQLGSRTDALSSALEDLGEFGWLIVTDAEMLGRLVQCLKACPSRAILLADTGWRIDLEGGS
jgi:hypothetical protein